MELLALIIINLFIAVILYYSVSIRVISSVKDYQNKKILKETEKHISTMFQVSENYLNLLDNKILIIKNLLAQLEKQEKSENFKNSTPSSPEQQVRQKAISLSSELLEENIKSEEYLNVAAEGIANEYIKVASDLLKSRHESAQEKKTYIEKNKFPKDDYSPLDKKENLTINELDGGLIALLGKGVKNLLGIKETGITETIKMPEVKTNTLDFTVAGNPFSGKNEVKDNKSQQNSSIDAFKELFDSIQNNHSGRISDTVNLSIKAVLKELPKNSSKIDTVVFLLKRNFSSDEIGEELGMATPEVELIKTFRLERPKR